MEARRRHEGRTALAHGVAALQRTQPPLPHDTGAGAVAGVRWAVRAAGRIPLVFAGNQTAALGEGGPGGGDFDRSEHVAWPLPPNDDWKGESEALARAMPHRTPSSSPPSGGRRRVAAEGPRRARSGDPPEPSGRQPGRALVRGSSRGPEPTPPPPGPSWMRPYLMLGPAAVFSGESEAEPRESGLRRDTRVGHG